MKKESDKDTKTARLPDRPLVPTPSMSKHWLIWVMLGIVGPLAGLIWVAVRIDCPPYLQPVMDGLVQVGFGLCIVMGSYRLLTYFPFRFFDLFMIVVMLSIGVMLTIRSLEQVGRSGVFFEGGLDQEKYIGLTVLWCLVVVGVLLFGAAMGLRYCYFLELDRTLIRMWAVFCGMLALPACSGMFVAFAFVVSDLLDGEFAIPPLMEKSLIWLASCIINLFNAYFLIRSLALKTQIKGGRK